MDSVRSVLIPRPGEILDRIVYGDAQKMVPLEQRTGNEVWWQRPIEVYCEIEKGRNSQRLDR